MEAERNKIRSSLQDLEREANRLNRKLNAAPKVSPRLTQACTHRCPTCKTQTHDVETPWSDGATTFVIVSLNQTGTSALGPQGTGFSEAIATLEAEVKTLKAENAHLDSDNKGAYNQIRAKDKHLDTMALEVEEARRILIQNGVSPRPCCSPHNTEATSWQSSPFLAPWRAGSARGQFWRALPSTTHPLPQPLQELQNYILQMRSQLQEADQEKATMLMVQRQNKADIAKLTEGLEAAQGKRESLDRELALAHTQLKVRLLTSVSAWQAAALFS